jgi:hypothetical protein
MVPAMVCLVLVGLLCAAVLRLAHTQRGVVVAEEHRMQAEWLAESGLARAAARLADDPGYKGEIWDVAAGSLGGDEPGVVRIAVEAVKDAPKRRRVRAEADFPAGTPRRARLSKGIIVDVGTERPGGPS